MIVDGGGSGRLAFGILGRLGAFIIVDGGGSGRLACVI